jgi:hypothetical protein
MRRTTLAALALALVAATPARAAVPLGGAPDGLLALTVSGGVAHAVVGSGDRTQPFALVRSGGRGRSAPQRFGSPGAGFPDVAAGRDDGVVVSWGQRISTGQVYAVAHAAAGGALSAPQTLTSGTGPARLALEPDGAPLLAYPDLFGDATLADGGAETKLTDTAPERRHLPLDVAVDAAGRTFVLDLVQTGASSALVLLGPVAPAAPAVWVPAVRDLPATLAIDGGRAYVAYGVTGRVHLAVAPLDPAGTWSSRRLPGRGGGAGAPAVVRSGGRTLVAYTQRQRHGRGDVFLADGAGVRRLTRTTADERFPLAAASPTGDVFVGWSRGRALRGPSTAVLTRVG